MRLLVVDDHEVVRRGVRSLLSDQPGWDVCGEAVDGQDAVEKARDLKPDLIVMDVSMPRLNGLEATRQVRSILPECEVLVLSQHENSEMARQALKAGARGYVVKSSISRDLISAVGKASRHEYFFDPAILDQTATAHTDVQEILQRSAAFEKALRDSEERLRKLADYQSAVMSNMVEGLYALDADGLLTSINRAGEEILGWTREELLGKKMHDVTHYKHPDGSPYPASECPGLQVVQKGATLRECEETFIRKDGSFVPVVFSASLLKENGKTAGVIVSFRDDTEQRRAREALLNAKRELEVSANHLRLVTNSMAASVTRCSQDLRYQWVNQSYADWLNRPSDQIIGKQIVDVIGKEAFDKLLPYFRKVLSGEQVAYEEQVMLESIGLRWISAVYTPTRDATGTPDGWIAAVADITDRKSAENELRASKEQLLLALQSSSSAMFDWDVAQRRGDWNPQMAAIYGFKPKSEYITAEEWVTLFHPDDVERLRIQAEQFWKEGDEFSFDFRTTPRNGKVKWISSHGRVVRDANGNAVRMIGTHTDITDRKQAEETLKHSEARLRAAFSQSYSFLVLLQPDGTIIEANRAARDAAGGNVVGRKFWEPWWSPLPEEVARLKKIITNVAAGQSVRDECSFCLPDGTLRVGDRSFNPVLDDNGKVVMIVATGLDITERKQTEAAIETGARQQKALFHLADELHRAGSMEDVYNAALNAILDSLQCNRASVLLCDDAAIMHFKGWRGLSREYRAATDGHSAWRPDDKNPQPVCVSDINAADFPEALKAVVKKEGIAALAFIPLVSNGKLIGKFMVYFNTPHEFTPDEIELSLTIARQLSFAIERKRNDNVLEQSKKATALLAAIVTSSDDAIVSKNLDGLIQTWNAGAEHIFGYTAKEAIGQHITLIIPPDRYSEEEYILARLRRNERIDHFETVRRRKDGTLIDVSVTISPVVDSSGRVIGASKVARDITARKRAAEQIRIADEAMRLIKAQDQERRRIARDFHDSAGQTLTVLGLSLAELVQHAEVISPELAKEGRQIEEIVQQLHREIRTTTYLLHPPLLDEAGLNSALSWYVQGLAERSRMAIDFNIAKDFGRLPAEMELAIFRVVQECLTNIHRHAQSKTARIRIARENGSVCIEVGDEGKGISPERLAEIEARGSGVGIGGIRERLRQFQGKMRIESNGSGTTVFATIPLAVEARSTDAEPVQAAV